MALDILEGDVLVGPDGGEYAIRRMQYWEWRGASLARRMWNTAVSTKRDGAAHLAGLKSSPIDPVSSDRRIELSQQLGLDTPFALREAHVHDSGGFWVLLVEDLKR